MTVMSAPVAGVLLLTPPVQRDARGFFMESYQQAEFAAAGVTEAFVQDNQSRSAKGVLRGLHFQCDPLAQGKLVRVSRGRIFDVAVDIRPRSSTFGQWVGYELSDDQLQMVYLPPGVAHGFLALEDDTDVAYKVTRPHSPAHERGIVWNDPALKIAWPDLGRPYVVSDKDRAYPTLAQAVSPQPARTESGSHATAEAVLHPAEPSRLQSGCGMSPHTMDESSAPGVSAGLHCLFCASVLSPAAPHWRCPRCRAVFTGVRNAHGCVVGLSVNDCGAGPSCCAR